VERFGFVSGGVVKGKITLSGVPIPSENETAHLLLLGCVDDDALKA